MQFPQTIQVFVVLAGLACAAPQPAPQPNPLLETVMLSNGTATVAVEVEAVSPVAAASGGAQTGGEIHMGGEIVGRGEVLLARQDSTNCKGSSWCTNNQSFKDECTRARTRLEDTVYRTGGSLFVQGNGCSATREVMRAAYDSIRRAGCQTCGSAHF
ncbi:hypothetical protein GGTG_08416 [Gaeumannomyces tritici R3-111a-1]|uniref:Pectate lyase n=1 Tax=Gaeumannomyces tritici (strain R3-111a-1) TaxID=644352 RepID=J3P4H9_GAET3|nr:hypothetical protein GGTG_08416 [Gaeumannomyces tritici R3-111a-1]EJT74576.1 hypothetical protein GGTG_08416 [Gaeumannomyces tritici R3-111a-1]